MNASKENAAEALRRLKEIPILNDSCRQDVEFIAEFLEAANRKLPYERSFQREKDHQEAVGYHGVADNTPNRQV